MEVLPMMKSDKIYSVILDKTEKKAIEKFSKKRRRSVAYIIKITLEYHIEQMSKA